MRRRPLAPARPRRPLRLEVLEGRDVPAVVNWTLGADGNFANPLAWTDASNGSNHVPGPADDAVISAGVAVTSAANQTVNSVTTAGTLRVDGGTLTLTNTWTQTAGVTAVAAGAVVQTPTFQLSGGTLEGGGTVVGNVTGGGTVSPTSQLTVNGNVTLAGPLALDLTGTAAAPQVDRLRVTGTVSLAGPLDLTNTLTPAVGTAYTILDNAGTAPVAGQFQGLPHGAVLYADGQNYFISYLADDGNNVALVAVATPVRVADVRVNDGAAQRSHVRSLTVTFTGPVSFANNDPAAAFRLRHLTHGADVALAATTATDAQGRTVVTLTFSGPETDAVSGGNGAPPSLADGRYRLTIVSGSVTGTANGLALDGDADGTAGGDFVSGRDTVGGSGPGLYRVFGDATGSGVVDLTDLAAFRATFNSTAPSATYVAALDADNNGVVDLFDLGQFRSRFSQTIVSVAPPPTFYVNPATGSDANDGRSPAAAWATWGRLLTAVQDGTIFAGDWEAPDGSLADISTVPTVAAKDAWYAAYLAGDRHVTGPSIAIDTSAAPLQVTAPLVLPFGTEIRSATAANARLLTNVPVVAETWSQPNAANFPSVWETTGATNYNLSALYEQVGGQWAQLLPVGGQSFQPVPNLAAALPLLQASPGSFYVDPTTGRMYTHALGGGNPNADGVSRERSVNFFGFPGGRVLDVQGARAYRITMDGGFGYNFSDANVYGHAGIGINDWAAISVIDGCSVSRAGRHSFGNVGPSAGGFTVMRNNVGTLGPAGVFAGAWSHFVDYTAAAVTGTAYSIYDGCSTVDGVSNLRAPGGSDPTGNIGTQGYTSFLAHNNGVGTPFLKRTFINCDFRGATNVGGLETAAVVSTGNTFGDVVVARSGTWASDHDTFLARVPVIEAGTTALTAATIRPSATYAGQFSGIRGTVTITDGTIDLSAGNAFSTAWQRSGPLNLTIDGTAVTPFGPNTGVGLINQVLDTDAFRMTGGAELTGDPNWTLFGTFNGGPWAKSWQWARNAGMIDATVTLNGAAWAAVPFAARATFNAPTGTSLAAYTPEAGPQFTVVSGTGVIDGNEAMVTSSNTNLAWLDSGRATGPAAALLRVVGTGAPNGGIVVNGVDANNYWAAVLTGTTLYLYERTGGVFVNRGSVSVSAAVGSKHALTVDPQGDTIRVSWDGAVVITYTAANRPHKTATNAGLVQYAGGSARFDDFEVP